ncbi:MAG: transcriptional regulator [Scytonematopsis contorta HA4267-MV1]|nr:transcriptional regulator [Scytonematopsis contorta HA4267-MV1]
MEYIKRIEIITNALEVEPVIEILNKVGVSGYSIIKDVTGSGDRGKVRDDLETTALTNVYVLSVCQQEKEEELVTAITPILKKFGGVCIVSDAKWIEH